MSGWRDPNSFASNIGQQLRTFGRFRELFGLPTPYIRHANAFGNVSAIVPSTGTPVTVVPSTGSQVQQRYRISLRVVDTTGGVGLTVLRGVRFFVATSLENEQIIRRVFVPASGATTLFVEGRTLGITAESFSSVNLQVHVSVDEDDGSSSGFSTWTDVQVMQDIAVTTSLDIPPFCQSFILLSPTGTPAPTLTGFSSAGIISYSEVIAVPRSTEIPHTPGLFYQLTPVAGAPRQHVVHYTCEG